MAEEKQHSFLISPSRTCGSVTLGDLPAQDLEWDSKDKNLHPEKYRKTPYPDNFWCWKEQLQ